MIIQLGKLLQIYFPWLNTVQDSQNWTLHVIDNAKTSWALSWIESSKVYIYTCGCLYISGQHSSGVAVCTSLNHTLCNRSLNIKLPSTNIFFSISVEVLLIIVILRSTVAAKQKKTMGVDWEIISSMLQQLLCWYHTMKLLLLLLPGVQQEPMDDTILSAARLGSS